MGNCLALQEKPIKVMKTDGEILEYRAPMKVHQLLSQYSGHAISNTIPVVQHLRADADMLSGHLYYLLPLPVPSPELDKKNLRYSASPKAITGEKNPGVVRIKLVISKKELELMLRKGGVSVNEIVSKLHNKQSANAVDKMEYCSDHGNGSCKGWKPVLQSIPEIN